MSTEHAESEHRVLVIDDEQDTVEMVLRILRGHYRAVGCNSATEALEWLEAERFDAVLVDQRLGDGTGTAVLSRCAALHPLCRRIAMSGQAELGDLLAAINVAHVSRFVMKPFTPDGLLTVMADVMAEYRAERTALERMLVDRSAQAGEKQLVAPRRGGRRTRGPAGPPTGRPAPSSRASRRRIRRRWSTCSIPISSSCSPRSSPTGCSTTRSRASGGPSWSSGW
jgi:response regulator RpfG family c-di-GMP phosphodiesterase